jgi:hypothetical protein
VRSFVLIKFISKDCFLFLKLFFFSSVLGLKRYASRVSELGKYFSEHALIKVVEII